MRLDKQVIIVSGAAAGIGKATAIRLAAEGAKLLCLDRDESALAETVGDISAQGGTALGQACDISVEEEVQAVFARCVEAYGRLDHLCNIAGIVHFDHLQDISVPEFQQVLDVNLVGTFIMCREALPHLKASRGSIVNVASTAATGGTPWMAAYSASKGAVLSMTRSMAVEFAAEGIRVNCVSPGQIETHMTSPDLLPENIDYNLLRRCMALTGSAGPDAVAGVIAMLVSPDGHHVSGENIRVDGAMLA